MKKLKNLLNHLRFNKIHIYKSISDLPILNWFKIIHGDLSFVIRNRNEIKYKTLNKFMLGKVKDLNEVILYFISEFSYFDTSTLQLKAQVEYLNALYLKTKDTRYLFEKNSLKKRIIEIEKNSDININDFINYIELTFNDIAKINPKELSTSRAYSLYYKAVEKNSTQWHN